MYSRKIPVVKQYNEGITHSTAMAWLSYLLLITSVFFQFPFIVFINPGHWHIDTYLLGYGSVLPWGDYLVLSCVGELKEYSADNLV